MKRLEIHRHAIISGPNAHKSWCNSVTHSHEGGDSPHEHEHTGPASYTIDKDEWFRATGLKGGGRKKFTTKPHGPQLQAIPREPMTFDVIVVESKRSMSSDAGPGIAPIARIEMAFKARAQLRRASR